MTRTDLVRTLESFGCVFVRHGGRHDWYRNPGTGVSQPVPRHREINAVLAKHIIDMLSNPDDASSQSKSSEEQTS